MADAVFTGEGEWYRVNMGRVMQVVACDEDNDAIEVQLCEGELAGFGLDGWNPPDVERDETPEGVWAVR